MIKHYDNKRARIFFIFIIILLLQIFWLMGCNDLKSHKLVSIKKQNETHWFSTISEAIDFADDEDIIIIKNGLYNEKINIDKSICLIGENQSSVIIENKNKENIINIKANNVTIRNLTIKNAIHTGQSIGAGIKINASDVKMHDLTCLNNTYGIYCSKSENITIKNSTIINNEYRGIFLASSNYIFIHNNTIYENQYGIFLNNVFLGCIENNTIFSNTEDGIYITYLSTNNTINKNTFFQNKGGIHIKQSTKNTIFKNVFDTNNCGLTICCGSENNLIYKNTFINNTNQVTAYLENNFDNGSIGNYWDDYTGNDADGDGIGEKHYVIYGSPNRDRYPLIKPYIEE